MASLFAAFQFLTVFPTVIRRRFTPGEMGRAVGFFPLVGLVLGGALFGLDSGLRLFLPPYLSAVLVVAAWLTLTRALHFDGFLDIFDGLFGGFTPERRLEIMHDSRVGAFGVAAGALLIFAKLFAIIGLMNRPGAFLLAPVLARWAMGTAIFAFPYAREHGLGRDMKDKTGWSQILFATFLSLAAAWFAGSWFGLLVLVLSAILLFIMARYVLTLIPGLTGDCYGAICELTELFVLIAFTVTFR